MTSDPEGKQQNKRFYFKLNLLRSLKRDFILFVCYVSDQSPVHYFIDRYNHINCCNLCDGNGIKL